MIKPETQFRKKVRADLKSLKALGLPIFYEPIQQKAIKGSMDFVLCICGHFMALELKDVNGTLSAIQESKLKDVADCGGLAVVCTKNSWQEVFSLIKSLAIKGETHDRKSAH